MKPIKLLLNIIGRFKWKLIIIFVLLLASSIIGFLQPLAIQQITDKGMMLGNFTVVIKYACALAFLIILSQVIDLTIIKLFACIHGTTYGSLFAQVNDKLMHLKKNYFEDKNSAEILNFLQMDVSQVSSLVDQYSATCVGHIFRMISGLVGLCIISWKLTLVVIAMVPIKFVLVQKLSHRQEKIMGEILENNRDFSRWFADELNGIDEIKLWNLFQNQKQIFASKQKKILNGQIKLSMVGGWNTFGESILEWSVSIILYVLGGFLVCTNALSIGSIFAFISYSGYVTGPVSALLNLKMHLARIMPSCHRLLNFLSMETEPDTGVLHLWRSLPEIEFRNVNFQYDNTRIILKNINFTVKPGKK